jgi:hypothetical protein
MLLTEHTVSPTEQELETEEIIAVREASARV